VLVELLGKVLGPLGFPVAVVREELSLSFGLTSCTSGLIWWVPCTLMLLRSYQDGPAKETST
jgi:hypothetical protein